MGSQCTSGAKNRQQNNINKDIKLLKRMSYPQTSTQGTHNEPHDSFYGNFGHNEEMTFSNENIQTIYNFDPQIIGKGEFGQVRTASLKSCPRKKFAIKTISKEKVKMEMIKNEVEILKNCDHPNIVKFHQTYQDQKFLHLVLQYCRGGQLQHQFQTSRTSVINIKNIANGTLKKVNVYSEEQTRDIMYKIFSSVKYMHQMGIVHRDLKLENFVFMDKTDQSCELKLIDFGLSEKFCSTSDRMKAVAGTFMYIAPEILEQNGYTKACDYWSCGVILFHLLSGEYPFVHKDQSELFKLIKQGKFNLNGELWKKVSKEAKDLINKLLVVDYSKRITASEALEHAFFKPLIQKRKGELKKQQETILEKLMEFQEMPSLKYNAYKWLISLMDEGQLKGIRQKFRLLDIDNDGLISVQDLQNCQKEFKQQNKLSDQDIGQIIFKMTQNCENKRFISYTQFIIAHLRGDKDFLQQNFNVVFNLFDIDHTGKMTKDNLIKSMAREGRKLKNDDIENIIEQVDFDQDHEISKVEFWNLIKYDSISDMKTNCLKEISHKKQSEDDEQEKFCQQDMIESNMDIDNQIENYKMIYNRNQKNSSNGRQNTNHKQVRQNFRKQSVETKFDDEDFEQKLIEDQYMPKFSTTNTSNNQLEMLKLLKQQNSLQDKSIRSALQSELPSQNDITPQKSQFSIQNGNNNNPQKQQRFSEELDIISVQLNNNNTNNRHSNILKTPEIKQQSQNVNS